MLHLQTRELSLLNDITAGEEEFFSGGQKCPSWLISWIHSSSLLFIVWIDLSCLSSLWCKVQISVPCRKHIKQTQKKKKKLPTPDSSLILFICKKIFFKWIENILSGNFKLMFIFLEKMCLDLLGISANLNLYLNAIVQIKSECLAILSSWDPKKNPIWIWGHESEGTNRASGWTFTAKFCKVGKRQCCPRLLSEYTTKYNFSYISSKH